MAEPTFSTQLDTLLAEFTRSGLRELHLRSGEIEIYLSNDPSARAAEITTLAHPLPPLVAAPVGEPAKPAALATIQELPADAVIVRAPNLGTFYGAPKPGSAAYVEIGGTIAVGAELCLIEVMKLFTTVKAETAGRVQAIFVRDGEMVEAGQPLFAIGKI